MYFTGGGGGGGGRGGHKGRTMHFFRVFEFYAQRSVRPHKSLPKTPRKTSWRPENTKNSDRK